MTRIFLLAITSRAAGATAVIATFALAPAAMSGCSKDSDGATAPTTASACSSAGFDSNAGIGFQLGCNSVSVSVSGITYDQFSRRTSYNYDMACSDGTNRKTGRVYNIAYNNIGQALTWDYTVNGTTCKKT